MGRHHDLPTLPYIYTGDTGFVRQSTGDPGDYEIIQTTYEFSHTGLVYKAIIDHDPGQRSDFTVLIIYGLLKRRIAFWRPGNLVWTTVESNYYFDDITLFGGNFYAVVVRFGVSRTYHVDVGPDPKVTQIVPEVPSCEDFMAYLVDFRGELLLLQMCHMEDVEEDYFLTKTIIVYKLDLEEGKYYRRNHLDGYSIFVSNILPSIMHGNQFLGCKENCIYFTAHPYKYHDEYGLDDNGIYDMVEDTVSPYYLPEIYHPKNVGPISWTPNPW